MHGLVNIKINLIEPRACVSNVIKVQGLIKKKRGLVLIHIDIIKVMDYVGHVIQSRISKVFHL